MYAADGEGDPKAALNHLEAVRAYFLGATHSQDPGGQSVRLVAFHSEGDFAKFRPADVGSARAYAQQGAVPATIAVLGLKPEMYEQVFQEYAQLVLDESAPSLPYWFRAGLAAVYSTLKPGEGTLKLGSPQVRGFKVSGVNDGLDLNALVNIDRAGMLASRAKEGVDFNSDTPSASLAASLGNGAATTKLSQVQSKVAQDYSAAAWLLTHMLMFSPDYRPKFSEFLGALAGGTETGAAFNKVYGRSLSQVNTDVRLYAKQPGLAVATVKFAGEKPAVPQVKAATKEEEDRIFADLSRKGK
jgi:hypothetical protein